MKQQGDVCLERKPIPTGAVRKAGLILAEGEATGHAHQIRALETAIAELFEEKGTLYLRVLGGSVELVHEEHKPLAIEPGEYEVGRILEYDYETEEAKRVQD